MDSTQEHKKLPPFLKFFDPYAVLEPEKVGKSTDSQNNDSEQDVSGSLITLKKDANVVDVFDNLFVTPQQVTHNGNTNCYDEEFAKFLDKYEEEKVGKLIDISESKPKSIKLYPDENSKVLEPKLVINDNVDEDLIDELILEKSIENMRLKEIADNIDLTKIFPDNFRSNIYNDKNIKKSVRDAIATNSRIVIDEKPNKDAKSTTQHSSMKPTTVIPNNNEQKISHILAKQYILKPSILRENVYKCNIYIETVAKDPKAFKKQRKVKSDNEVLNYTKGAGLQEKLVVLPQIMERLTKRNIAHENKMSLERKMLLDAEVTAATKENYISENEFTCRREVKRKQVEEFINHQQIGDLSVNLDQYKKFDTSTSKNIYDRNNDTALLKMNDGSSEYKPNNTNEVFTSDIQRYILSTRESKHFPNEASTSKVNEDHTMNNTQGNTTLPSFLKFLDLYAVSELIKVWEKITDSQNADLIQNISGSFLTVKKDPNVGNDKKTNGHSKHTTQVDSNMAHYRIIQNNNEPNISQILAKQNIPTPTSAHENSQKCKIFIETVSKDPKVFQKRRIVKSEKETSKYTKGASLQEKNVVLPQIMERLINRNIAHEMKNNVQKKLLLDTGVTVATKENDVSDNEFTYRREIKRKQMEEFINHQQIGDLSVNLNEYKKFDASTTSNIYDRNNDNSLLKKTNNGASELKLNEVFTSDIQRYILSTRNLKDSHNEASTSKTNKGNQEVGSINYVLHPEVLMEDCNRQRLIEFQRRRLFENFVRNEKSD